MSTSAQSPSARVVIVIVPFCPSASIALSSRLVQTWLSSAVDHHLAQVRVVVPDDLDARVLELVLEDRQGRVQALAQVHFDDPAAVHVRVLLDRDHQLAHLVGRGDELGRQLAGRERGRDPAQDRIGDRAGGVGDAVQVVRVQAGAITDPVLRWISASLSARQLAAELV